jgi:hypothetical protein
MVDVLIYKILIKNVISLKIQKKKKKKKKNCNHPNNLIIRKDIYIYIYKRSQITFKNPLIGDDFILHDHRSWQCIASKSM